VQNLCYNENKWHLPFLYFNEQCTMQHLYIRQRQKQNLSFGTKQFKNIL
jgi:hypothetical protein